MVLMNLPRTESYMPENVFSVVFAGPHEPKLKITTYLQPFVAELNVLWKDGVSIKPHGSTTRKVCASQVMLQIKVAQS